jgi:hypothetical protein
MATHFGCSQDSAFNTAQAPLTETKKQTVGSEVNTSDKDVANSGVTKPESVKSLESSDSTAGFSSGKDTTSAANAETDGGGTALDPAATLISTQVESENGSPLGQVITAQLVQMRVQQQQQFDLRSEIKQQEVVVAPLQQKIEWSFRQPFLKPGSLEKTQGTGERPQEEMFEQTAAGLLDVLVVVDNSGSMSQEQSNLATRLSDLLSSVKDSNWQIGLISTDPSESKIRTLIKKSDVNAEQAFKDAVNSFGVNGSGNERGVLQAVNGLKSVAPGATSGTWLRPNSVVALLIVSDEDNCSDGNDCKNADGTLKDFAKKDYLIDYLNSIRVVGTNARAYGIFYVPGDLQCSTGLKQAFIYKDLVNTTSGKFGSICDNSYGTTLSAISADIKTILKQQFELKNEPAANSVKVFVNGSETSKFVVSGRVVSFPDGALPPVGSNIKITYMVQASSAYFTRLTLTEKPVIDSLTVQVDAAILAPTDFSYRADDKSLTFKSLPPEGARVLVRYKIDEAPVLFPFDYQATVLQSSYVLKLDADGSMITGWKVGPEGVTLAQALPEGTGFTLTGFRVLGPQLVYPVDLGSGIFYRVLDSQGNPIAATYQDGKITLTDAAVVPGTKFMIESRVSLSDNKFKIDAGAIAGTISVTVDSVKCEVYTNDQGSLSLDPVQCPIVGAKSVVVSYQMDVMM